MSRRAGGQGLRIRGPGPTSEAQRKTRPADGGAQACSYQMERSRQKSSVAGRGRLAEDEMRPISALLIALALPALGGRNQVYSRQPLVSEAREQGDPEFRPGLWSSAGYNAAAASSTSKPRRDPGPPAPSGSRSAATRCSSSPATTGPWPTYLPPGRRPTAPAPAAHAAPTVLTDPRVPEPKDTDNPFYGWTYAAIAVLKTDAAGRITQAEMVQAECGPLPAKTDLPAARKSASAGQCHLAALRRAFDHRRRQLRDQGPGHGEGRPGPVGQARAALAHALDPGTILEVIFALSLRCLSAGLPSCIPSAHV